jgi:hypothetical protein
MEVEAVDHRLSAVIEVSEFGESPENAIKSVIELNKYFADVHLVKFGYDTSEPLYDDFLEDVTKLGDKLTWHSTFDHHKAKTRAICYIAPDLVVSDGALKTLVADMIQGNNSDHFAIKSITVIEFPSPKPTIRDYLETLSYGFLLVVMMLDALRAFWSVRQYHRTADLRVRFLNTTWPNNVRLAPYNWHLWLFFTRTSAYKDAGSGCEQVPSRPEDQGFSFVLRTIKTHNHMYIKYGSWFLGYLVYWYLFSYPFWNSWFDPNSRIGWWIVRDLNNTAWMIAYLAHAFLVGYYAWQYMMFPIGILLPFQVLTYTFYLTLSPIVILFGRFYSSRNLWKKKSKKRRAKDD